MKLSYLSYFFTYETHIPDGIGFALFLSMASVVAFGYFCHMRQICMDL